MKKANTNVQFIVQSAKQTDLVYIFYFHITLLWN